jgi:hypothetical protein
MGAVCPDRLGKPNPKFFAILQNCTYNGNLRDLLAILATDVGRVAASWPWAVSLPGFHRFILISTPRRCRRSGRLSMDGLALCSFVGWPAGRSGMSRSGLRPTVVRGGASVRSGTRLSAWRCVIEPLWGGVKAVWPVDGNRA